MLVNFYISSAGIAGDPDKLLVMRSEDIKESILFDTSSFLNWQFYYSVFVLTRRIRKKLKAKRKFYR